MNDGGLRTEGRRRRTEPVSYLANQPRIPNTRKIRTHRNQISIPLMLSTKKKDQPKGQPLALFSSLVICELALILAGARAGWVYGMGYESFNWHGDILASIPGSYYSEFHIRKEMKMVHQTPHSIFYQLFVSGGIVGFCLWMLIVGYALLLLILDLIKNKRLLNIPVVISIISFHIYGIFQSMQYMGGVSGGGQAFLIVVIV